MSNRKHDVSGQGKAITNTETYVSRTEGVLKPGIGTVKFRFTMPAKAELSWAEQTYLTSERH